MDIWDIRIVISPTKHILGIKNSKKNNIFFIFLFFSTSPNWFPPLSLFEFDPFNKFAYFWLPSKIQWQILQISLWLKSLCNHFCMNCIKDPIITIIFTSPSSNIKSKMFKISLLECWAQSLNNCIICNLVVVSPLEAIQWEIF